MLSHNHYFYKLAKEVDAKLTDDEIDEIYDLIWSSDGPTDNKDKGTLKRLIKEYIIVIREG